MCDQLEPFIAILNEQYLPSRTSLYKERLRNQLCDTNEPSTLARKGYLTTFDRRSRFRVPVWANYIAIGEKFAEANLKSTEDVKFHVDHIIPLKGGNGGLVCGLHCESNMAVLPKRENLLKSCRHWPDMPDYEAMPNDEFLALKKGGQSAQYDYNRMVMIEEDVVNGCRKSSARKVIRWYHNTIDDWGLKSRRSLEKLKRDWDKYHAIQQSAITTIAVAVPRDNELTLVANVEPVITDRLLPKPHRLAAALAWKPNQDTFNTHIQMKLL
jgi:hypothetical protein